MLISCNLYWIGSLFSHGTRSIVLLYSKLYSKGITYTKSALSPASCPHCCCFSPVRCCNRSTLNVQPLLLPWPSVMAVIIITSPFSKLSSRSCCPSRSCSRHRAIVIVVAAMSSWWPTLPQVLLFAVLSRPTM